jgi:hypothetical protein
MFQPAALRLSFDAMGMYKGIALRDTVSLLPRVPGMHTFEQSRGFRTTI